MRRKRLALFLSLVMAFTTIDGTTLMVSADEPAAEFQSGTEISQTGEDPFSAGEPVAQTPQVDFSAPQEDAGSLSDGETEEEAKDASEDGEETPAITGLSVEMGQSEYIYDIDDYLSGYVNITYDNDYRYDVYFNSYSYSIADEYNHIVEIVLTDSEGQEISDRDNLSAGNYTVTARYGEITDTHSFSVVDVEDSSLYKGEIQTGSFSGQYGYAYYKFVPGEDGKYLLTGDSSWITLYHKTQDGYEYLDYYSYPELKQGETYYYYFDTSYMDKYLDLHKASGLIQLSVNLDSSKPIRTAANLNNGNLLRGTEVTFTYEDGTVEKGVASRGSGEVVSPSGYRATLELEKDGDYFSDISYLDKGTYQLRYVCNGVKSESYSVEAVDVEESDLYSGSLTEGQNTIRPVAQKGVALYSFIPAKDDLYSFSNRFEYDFFTRTENGYEDLYENYGGYQLTAGKVYYFRILFDDEQEQNPQVFNINIKNPITNISVSPVNTYEIIGEMEDPSIIADLNVTYRNGEIKTYHVDYGYVWDVNEDFITAVLTGQDGTEYSYYQVGDLEPGTYSVRFQWGEVRSDEYEFNVLTFSQASKGDLKTGSSQTIVNGRGLRNYYRFHPEKEGKYYFRLADQSTSLTIFRENMDEEGNNSYRQIYFSENEPLYFYDSDYYLGFESNSKDQTEFLIDQVPEVTSVTVKSYSPANLSFIENLQNVQLDALEVQVKFSNGIEKALTLNDTDNWDEYDNHMEVRLYQKTDTGREIPVYSLKPHAGDYLFRVTYGEGHADIPVIVTPVGDNKAENLIPGEEKKSENVSGNLLYSFTPAEEGRYEITFNVPVRNIKIADENGTCILSTANHDNNQISRMYADLSAGKKYYLYSEAETIYPTLRVNVKKVAAPVGMTSVALKKSYIAGLNDTYDVKAKTKVTYSDGTVSTLKNYETVQGNQISYRVTKDGEPVEGGLATGTYQVTPYVMAGYYTGSAVYYTGSAFAADLTNVTLHSDEITAERIDVKTLKKITDAWIQPLRGENGNLYSFTAPSDGKYVIEQNDGIYSAFYFDRETGLEKADSEVDLKAGETVVVYARNYGSGKLRVVKENAQTPDTPADKPIEEGPYAISAGMKDQGISITSPGKTIDLIFTPEKDGFYVLESSGDEDTYVDLFDKNGNKIGNDDDGGMGSNFKITTELKKGDQYTYRVRLYDGKNTGSFSVSLSEKEIKKINSVELVPKGNTEDLNVLQNISSLYDIKVTYEDNTTWTEQFYLHFSYADNFGNHIDTWAIEENYTDEYIEYNGKISYNNQFTDKKGSSSEITIRQKKISALEKLPENVEQKKNISDGKDHSYYYSFIPEEDGEYLLYTNGTGYIQMYDKDANYISTFYTEGNYSLVRLKAGTVYGVMADFYNRDGKAYTFRFGIRKAKEIKDVSLLKAPDQKSIFKGSYSTGLSLKGMEVEVTYKDDSTEILKAGMQDEDGRSLRCNNIYWINDQQCRVYVYLENHNVSFTMNVSSPDELYLIKENIRNPLKISANEDIVVKFVPDKTGTYFFNSDLGCAVYGLEDEDGEIIGREGNGKYNLYAGRTYYITFHALKDNPSIMPVYDEANWSIIEKKPATCTEKGKIVKICLWNGETVTEEIPATGHKEVKDKAVAATCLTPGKTEGSHCSVCHAIVKAQKTVPAKGHSWSAWKTVTKATVFAPAKQTRTCSVCKKQETRTAGSKLTPTIKLNYTGLILQTRQSTSAVKVSGLANGDSVRSWKSSNTKIVKVDSRGKITAQKTTGKAYITVTLASKKTANIKVVVQKSAVKTTKLTGLQKKLTLKKGQSIILKPVRYPITSTEKITYASSNKKVVIVNSKGAVKAVGAGSAYITVKCGSAKFYVKVGVPKTKTTAISVAKSIKVKKGKFVVLKTKVTPANTDDKTVYASSNKKVATVTSKGVIKGVKKGKAVITVKSGSKSVKCTVTVV